MGSQETAGEALEAAMLALGMEEETLGSEMEQVLEMALGSGS